MTLYRKLWGRAQSHPLSLAQKELLERGLKSYQFDEGFAPDVLEIGFGDGEHFIERILEHRDKKFLGCEPFINGNVNVLKVIEENTLNHVRVWRDDVHAILDQLSKSSLDAIYVLFPDPWPKKRHQKRRLLQRIFIETLSTKLKVQGQLFMASDDPAYQAFIQDEASHVPSLVLCEIRTPPRTKYARKAEKAGRTSYLYVFEKYIT